MDIIINLLQKTFVVTLEMVSPILLVGMAVGLIISIFQTVTSIQEQTLTFVPKILCVFLAMMLCGSWMLDNMSGFMVDLWSDFSRYVSMG